MIDLSDVSRWDGTGMEPFGGVKKASEGCRECGDLETKYCLCCREEVQVSEFYRHPDTLDGLQTRCKTCMKAALRRRRQLAQSSEKG